MREKLVRLLFMVPAAPPSLTAALNVPSDDDSHFVQVKV